MFHAAQRKPQVLLCYSAQHNNPSNQDTQGTPGTFTHIRDTSCFSVVVFQSNLQFVE